MLRPTYWSPWWKVKLWKWVRCGTLNENVSIKTSFVVTGVTTLDWTVGKRGFYKKLLWIFYAWELVFFPTALLKTPSSFTVRPPWYSRENIGTANRCASTAALFSSSFWPPRSAATGFVSLIFCIKKSERLLWYCFWFVHSLCWRPPFASPKTCDPSYFILFFRACLNCWLRREAFSARDLMTAVGFFVCQMA